MTEEQIIQEAMKAVPNYLASLRRTRPFDIMCCVKHWELPVIERLFRDQYNLKKYDTLSREKKRALENAQAHFEPKLIELTMPIKDKYMRERKLLEINSTTAKAMLCSVFADIGINIGVECQRYRAKLWIPILKNRYIQMYFRYKDLAKPELLDDMLKAVDDLRSALVRLGPGACVKIGNK